MPSRTNSKQSSKSICKQNSTPIKNRGRLRSNDSSNCCSSPKNGSTIAPNAAMKSSTSESTNSSSRRHGTRQTRNYRRFQLIPFNHVLSEPRFVRRKRSHARRRFPRGSTIRGQNIIATRSRVARCFAHRTPNYLPILWPDGFFVFAPFRS